MESKICEGYINHLKSRIDKINIKEIVLVANVIKSAITANKNIFVIGNGDSMLTAKHLVGDLLLGNTLKTKIYALNNQAVLTAIPNDDEFENVFYNQLKCLMDEGDILISISSSGNSRNLIKAIDYANKIGFTIGISGFNGGYVKRKSNYKIYVKTKVGEYEITEDLHYVICHILAFLIKQGHDSHDYID